MQQERALDIVIPTYNGAGHLPRLLSSLEKQKFRDFRCFVIDDNSSDNTPELVKQKYPWVKLIEQEHNQGPAINRNIAIAAGHNPYIVIFDDDTYLEDALWLEKGVLYMEENPEVGQIAAMIVSGFEPDVLLDCGILKNQYLFGGIFHNQNIDAVQGKHRKSRRILGACSAGTILRRDALELIGGFDEKYFYPAEDLDVSMRLHLAGYDVIYEPSLLVYHYESQAMGKSLSRKMFMYRRNCLLTLVENFPILHSIKMLLAVVVREILYPVICYMRGFLTLKQANVLPDSVKDYIKAGLFLMKNCIRIMQKRSMTSRYLKRSRSYLLKINEELIHDLAS